MRCKLSFTLHALAYYVSYVLQQAGKILGSFASAFRRVPKSLAQNHESLAAGNNLFKFNVALEIKEDDGRGNFVACPKEKNFFKLRVNVDKKIVINVTQLGNQKELEIQRFV